RGRALFVHRVGRWPRARRRARHRGVREMKRRALVTGASGAIGAAICRRLAADGCEVIAHARGNLAAAEKLAAEIRGSAVAFDVSDADVVPTMIERLLEAGPIQILVNNAGIHD